MIKVKSKEFEELKFAIRIDVIENKAMGELEELNATCNCGCDCSQECEIHE